MNCDYGRANCLCAKCKHCKLCTNGSQVHRSCLAEFIEEDYKYDDEKELLASHSESLPTKEQEKAADKVQRNTPLSFEAESIFTFEENCLFTQTYQFETRDTYVEIAFPTLTKNYPNEDFDNVYFQPVTIHRYLTSEMTKFEFFLAHNQWEYDICHYPKDIPVKMRKGVYSAFKPNKQRNFVYHMKCIDDEVDLEQTPTKALLTVEARTPKEYLELIISKPELFFCEFCDHYIFDCIEHYSGKQFAIPSTDIWPTCEYLAENIILHRTNDETYADLFLHKVYPIPLQEPPRKKARIEKTEKTSNSVNEQ